MAVITTDQADSIARKINKTAVINITRLQYKAAIQALEDWYEGERATVGAALDAAVSPATLTNAEKKALARWFLLQKSDREV